MQVSGQNKLDIFMEGKGGHCDCKQPSKVKSGRKLGRPESQDAVHKVRGGCVVQDSVDYSGTELVFEQQ